MNGTKLLMTRESYIILSCVRENDISEQMSHFGPSSHRTSLQHERAHAVTVAILQISTKIFSDGQRSTDFDTDRER